MSKAYELGLYEKAMPGTLTWKERLEAAKAAGYDYVEISIDATEEKIARLNEEMSQTADDYVRLQELSQEQEKLETELEQKMDRWVYLNDLAEQIENQK